MKRFEPWMSLLKTIESFNQLNYKILNAITQPKYIEKAKSREKLDPLIQSNCNKWIIKITLFFLW